MTFGEQPSGGPNSEPYGRRKYEVDLGYIQYPFNSPDNCPYVTDGGQWVFPQSLKEVEDAVMSIPAYYELSEARDIHEAMRKEAEARERLSEFLDRNIWWLTIDRGLDKMGYDRIVGQTPKDAFLYTRHNSGSQLEILNFSEFTLDELQITRLIQAIRDVNAMLGVTLVGNFSRLVYVKADIGTFYPDFEAETIMLSADMLSAPSLLREHYETFTDLGELLRRRYQAVGLEEPFQTEFDTLAEFLQECEIDQSDELVRVDARRLGVFLPGSLRIS